MHSIIELFIEGGWVNFVILPVGLVSIIVGCFAAVSGGIGNERSRSMSALTLGLVAATLGIGVAGTSIGHLVTAQAIASFPDGDPAEKLAILRQGYLESRSCMTLAMLLTALPTLLALVGMRSSARATSAAGVAPSSALPAAMGAAILAWVGVATLWMMPLPGSHVGHGQASADEQVEVR